MPSASKRFVRRSGKSGKKRKPRYVLLLGARKAGKTALVRRFADGIFEQQYTPTVEDCFVMDYDFGAFRLNLHFLDTAGACEFPAMRDLNIKQASVIFLVYDVWDKKSFEEVEYIHQIIKGVREDGVPVVLVGAKTDASGTPGEYPTNSHANKFLSENPDCQRIFCSAKADENVTEAFHTGFEEMVKAINAPTLSHKEGSNACCCIS